MRTMVLEGFAQRLAGALVATGVVLSAIPAASAAPLSGDAVRGGMAATDSAVEQVQYGGYCDTLRRACLYKGALGERGLGNCARYRAECRGGGYSGYSSYRPYYRDYRVYRYDREYRPYRRYRYDYD